MILFHPSFNCQELGWHHPSRGLHMGEKLGRIQVHQSPLACLKCCPALDLVLVWPFLPQFGSQGGKWGRAGAEPLLLPVLCLWYWEPIPAGSGVCTHPTAPKKLPCSTGGNKDQECATFLPASQQLLLDQCCVLAGLCYKGSFSSIAV